MKKTPQTHSFSHRHATVTSASRSTMPPWFDARLNAPGHSHWQPRRGMSRFAFRLWALCLLLHLSAIRTTQAASHSAASSCTSASSACCPQKASVSPRTALVHRDSEYLPSSLPVAWAAGDRILSTPSTFPAAIASATGRSTMSGNQQPARHPEGTASQWLADGAARPQTPSSYPQVPSESSSTSSPPSSLRLPHTAYAASPSLQVGLLAQRHSTPHRKLRSARKLPLPVLVQPKRGIAKLITHPLTLLPSPPPSPPSPSYTSTGSSSGSGYTIGSPHSTFQKLTYHGGDIMTGAVPVYLIYYGTWGTAEWQSIIETFLNSILDSSADSLGISVREWFNLHTLYKDKSGNLAATTIFLAGKVNVNSNGDLLDTVSVMNVIYTQQKAGTIPYDTNALYAVLTSSGIKQGMGSDAFCVTYCGWHSAYSIATSVYKFMFVGWSGDCDGCKGKFAGVAPNGHPEMENMVSVLAHEITEAITNPTGKGFYDDSSQDENADACNAYYTGVVNLLPPYYNVYAINGYKYLIQSNINPITNQCENGNEVFLSLPPPAPPSPPPPPTQFCATRVWGRRCFTCGHPFCICKYGSCRWWRG